MEPVIPILLIFILITVSVAGALFVCLKYIKISDEMARRIEIFGYIMLFALIIWEFAFKNIFVNLSFPDDYYLHQKINTIFYALSDYAQGDTDVGNWNRYYSQLLRNESAKYITTQLLWVDIIETFLQIVSTVAIAFGRFQELRKNNNAKN